MAEIIVAKTAGFCFGVDRAVKIVYDELKKGGRVATLGPIIHNQSVVNDLSSKGVRSISSIQELDSDERIIIRSHGVARSVYDEIADFGCDYIDATCPFVSKIHKIVKKATDDGFFVLIAGDRSHLEVIGIMGYCRGNVYVFADDAELEEYIINNLEILEKKVAIVSQTTYNIILWDKCIKTAKKMLKNLYIHQTICNATTARQKEAVELAKRCDVMIIVGGRHSSNTVKLCNVCSPYCTAYHIEDCSELSGIDFSGAEIIGITAGASTPAYIIKEVRKQMSEMKNFDEDISFEEALEQSFKKIHTGERVRGYIAKVNNNEAIVDVGTKHTGYIPLDELTDDPSLKPCDVVKAGDEVDLIVVKINDTEGIVTLSKKRVDALVGYQKVLEASESGEVLEGVVQSVINGSLIVSCGGVRVFIPASHTGLRRDENAEVLVKKKVKFTIIDTDERRSRAVGSIRNAAKLAREAEQKKFWESAEIGNVYTGEVKSLTSYGAFVNLGGIDGMVHISELSWSRIKHPNEVVNVGDVVEVYIKDLDPEKNRISLGYKKSEDNPWEIFIAKYSEDEIVDALVVSITPFGAFAQICEGVDGLIHISQVADHKVANVKDVLSIGQTVRVKITEIDTEKKRISLSIRALLESAEIADEEDLNTAAEEEQAEDAAELDILDAGNEETV